MKKLIRKIVIDAILVSICIFIFKENSFVFGGLGIIYLGIILFQYFNNEKKE